jgi:hypothetical protein
MTTAYAGRRAPQQDDEGGAGWTLQGGALAAYRSAMLSSTPRAPVRAPSVLRVRLRKETDYDARATRRTSAWRASAMR